MENQKYETYWMKQMILNLWKDSGTLSMIIQIPIMV